MRYVKVYPPPPPTAAETVFPIAWRSGLSVGHPDELRSLIDNPVHQVYLVNHPRFSRRPVGYLLSQCIPPEGEILDLAVLPCFKRQGFGTLLLEACFREMAAQGVERCYLEVRESNTEAIGFYRRHGFTTCGFRSGYYTQPPENALCMSRTFEKTGTPYF